MQEHREVRHYVRLVNRGGINFVDFARDQREFKAMYNDPKDPFYEEDMYLTESEFNNLEEHVNA